MNCGIEAIQKIVGVNRVSLFTLKQIAKDNGIDLYLTKVDVADILKVPRPAILHSTDHFEYVMNGNPLPKQVWTGYVATIRPFNASITHGEAKKVLGGFQAVGAAIGAIVSAVTSVASSVVSAAVSGAQAVGAPLVKAATGLPGATSLIGGAKTAATVVGGGLIGAGIGGAVGGGSGALKGGLIGATGGLLGSGAASGLLSRVASTGGGALLGSAVGAVTAPKGASFGQTLGRAATGGLVGAGVGGAAGSFGAGFSGATGTGGAAATLGQKLSGGFKALVGAGGAKNLSGITGAGLSLGASLAGDALGPKRPELNFDPLQEFTGVRDLLGQNPLSKATDQELENLVSTPFNELRDTLTVDSDRIKRTINEKFDEQIENVKIGGANFGQSESNSSDIRNRIDEIERNRATVLSEADQEISNLGVGRAIEAKQFALSDALQKNNFDNQIAFQLADLIGVKSELENSIEQDDFETFQEIMGRILQIGFGQG